MVIPCWQLRKPWPHLWQRVEVYVPSWRDMDMSIVVPKRESAGSSFFQPATSPKVLCWRKHCAWREAIKGLTDETVGH